MWMQGQYTLLALMHVMSRLGKKGKRINYPDKPMLREQDDKIEEKILTEKDKKNERNKLLMLLQLMQINFEANHKNDNQSG